MSLSCEHVGLWPLQPSLLSSITSNHAISLRIAALTVTAGSCPSLCFRLAHCIIKQMTLCPSSRLFLPSLHNCYPLLSSSHPFARLSFRLSLPWCWFSLHINRTLVSASSARACLASLSLARALLHYVPPRCHPASFLSPVPPSISVSVFIFLFCPFCLSPSSLLSAYCITSRAVEPSQ